MVYFLYAILCIYLMFMINKKTSKVISKNNESILKALTKIWENKKADEIIFEFNR